MGLPRDLSIIQREEDREVLIWIAELDSIAESRLVQLSDLLSHDENQRASRFRFERDRRRFVACRGMLREILATYLEMEPKTIDFSYGAHGKPYLKAPTGSVLRSTSFNVSHSAGWAIYALSTSEVGVDLEVIRPVPEMDALVERYFSVSERNAFASIASDLRLKAFFSCWTRKEAYVKACGDGLLIPLDEFDVSLDPSLPARLISARGVSGDELNWALHSFDLSTDTIAALVCPRNSRPRLCGCWPASVESVQNGAANSKRITG